MQKYDILKAIDQKVGMVLPTLDQASKKDLEILLDYINKNSNN